MPGPIQPFGVHSFVLHIPDIDAAGFFMSCTGLELTIDVLEYREGGNNEVIHRLPTTLRYPNLVLSRGLTADDRLIKWIQAYPPELKEITLTLKTADAERTWTFADAYPIKWIGPTIDSSGAGVAMETVEIAHAGLKVG